MLVPYTQMPQQQRAVHVRNLHMVTAACVCAVENGEPCAGGSPGVRYRGNPCDLYTCAAHPNASCAPFYCPVSSAHLQCTLETPALCTLCCFS